MEFCPNQKAILALIMKQRNKESSSLEYIAEINSSKAYHYWNIFILNLLSLVMKYSFSKWTCLVSYVFSHYN